MNIYVDYRDKLYFKNIENRLWKGYLYKNFYLELCSMIVFINERYK